MRAAKQRLAANHHRHFLLAALPARRSARQSRARAGEVRAALRGAGAAQARLHPSRTPAIAHSWLGLSSLTNACHLHRGRRAGGGAGDERPRCRARHTAPRPASTAASAAAAWRARRRRGARPRHVSGKAGSRGRGKPSVLPGGRCGGEQDTPTQHLATPRPPARVAAPREPLARHTARHARCWRRSPPAPARRRAPASPGSCQPQAWWRSSWWRPLGSSPSASSCSRCAGRPPLTSHTIAQQPMMC